MPVALAPTGLTGMVHPDGEILAAPAAETFIDGGIRSGQDVLKARCPGADGAFIGRPFLYALGAMGAPGVTRAPETLYKEMDVTLALCGRNSVANASRDMLMPVSLDCTQ